MRKIFYSLTVLIVVLVSFTFKACEKMDSTYREFVVPGGIHYPGKITSPIIHSGHNRVKISWARGFDPSVVKAIIYWNNYTDSVVVNIPSTGDTISTVIDNLPEKSYSFIVKTYDKEGNVSVPVELLSAVYGDNYQASLHNRIIRESDLDTMGRGVIIYWGGADISNGAFATEVRYIDTLGDTLTHRFPISQQISIISDFKQGTSYQYRTLYLPDTLSIDTFYTNYGKNDLFALDKSEWKDFVLPTDAIPLGPRNGPDQLWDGVTNNRSNLYATPPKTPLPQWFTVDLGEKVVLNKFKEFQRAGYPYNTSVPLDFQIWGSNDPDKDGGWNNWLLLGTFHSFKPSGLPFGHVNADDNTYAVINGEDFQFAQPPPAVRYIRFKTLTTYGSPNASDTIAAGGVVISELTFWEQVP